MDIQLFIQNVADQFDELNVELTPETNFRKVEGWTSLVALLVITMVDEESSTRIALSLTAVLCA